MVSLLITGDFRSSPLDKEVEYLTQSLSVLSFLPPPKLGENADYKQDAVTTVANIVVFFEFVFDEIQSSEELALIMMLRELGKFLVTPVFRKYAEKNKHTIPLLTLTLICQFCCC